MAVRIHALMTVAVTAGLAAGCSLMSFGRDEPRDRPPEPLAAAPAGTVTGGVLPPPVTPPPGAIAPAPSAPGGLAALDPNTQTAMAAPGTVTGTPPAPVGRTDLLGGWTINSAGDSCQLFMTLTTWAGGYRASTRGCNAAALQTISAWNMEGGQVQLLNDAGSTIARLYPTSKTQFSGQTEGGGPITVSR
jgi:hypothetical protein